MSKDAPQFPEKHNASEQFIQRSDSHVMSAHVDLIETMLVRLEVFFTEKMAELFVNTDEHLFQRADKAHNTAEQNRLFEFMNALRKQREQIGNDFFDEINKYLRPVEVTQELPKKKTHAEPAQGLSLIGQDEMDEMVILSVISGNATADYHEEISHLEARLERLGLINRNIFHPRALEPSNICDAFQEALSGSGFDNRNKILLYKMFGVDVVLALKQLYDDLNGMMISDGILPQIEYTGKIRLDTRKQPEKVVTLPADNHDTREQEQGAPGRSSLSGGYFAASAVATHSTSMTGGAHDYRNQGTPQTNLQASTVTGQAADPRTSAGLPVGHIKQSIAGYVGGDPVSADASGGVDAMVYYTRQEVVTALSGVQNALELSPGAPLHFDASAIKKAVLASIGERSGGVVNKRVNQISEKTIDFIKLIFDAIIEDRGINDTIKALLLSLQIPIIKAAMLDADFFVDDKHPARQLLDRIAEAGVGVNDHKDPVYIDLNSIVKTLLLEYNEDISAFNAALDAIKALTERIYEQARKTEQQSQEQVKQAHARNVVLQEIRKITLGKELEPGIRLLVLKIWPSLMFNHYLRQGKANDEWVELLMILSKVIDSVQTHQAMTEMEDLGLSYNDLINSVHDKLKKCRKSADVLQQAIQDLRNTYARLEEQRKAHATQRASEKSASEKAAVVHELPPIIEPVIKPEPVTEKPAVITTEKSVSPTTVVASPEIFSQVKTKDVALPESIVASATQEAETTTATAVESDVEQDQDVAVPAEITPEQSARLKLDKLPHDVQPGAWFIVYNGENRPVRRLKLALILMQDATLVFVDHLGNVVIEKDAEIFAEELTNGKSGVIMQHSVFDHALRSALSTIQS